MVLDTVAWFAEALRESHKGQKQLEVPQILFANGQIVLGLLPIELFACREELQPWNWR